MFRTWVACGRNPRTAEALRPLRLFEQREGPHCSKYIAFCPSFQDAFPRFREPSARGPDRASHHAAAPNRRRLPASSPHLVAPPFSLPASSLHLVAPPFSLPASSLHLVAPPFSLLTPRLVARHRFRRGIGLVARATHRPANRSGRAFSRREASRACAPKRAQSGMIRLKYKETRPSSRPPPRSIRSLPPIARNEQVGFCRHFGRE